MVHIAHDHAGRGMTEAPAKPGYPEHPEQHAAHAHDAPPTTEHAPHGHDDVHAHDEHLGHDKHAGHSVDGIGRPLTWRRGVRTCPPPTCPR